MYEFMKLLHVTAVVLFLGNITTGLFWHRHAARTGQPNLLAHTMDGIIRSDRWFTIPSVIVITLTGLVAAMVGRIPILGTPWLFWALMLFALSGVVFMARVAPLQGRLLAMARAEAFDLEAYRQTALQWELWGGLALVTPFGALVLMLLKPAF